MAGFKILSLDGGGSWALIQIKALMDLYGKDTSGHEVLNRFDMVCANSGGTLSLAGLILNWPLSRTLEVFRDETQRKQVFVRSSLFKDPFSHLTNLADFGPKYDTAAKYIGLRALLGATGDRLVTDLPGLVARKPDRKPLRFVLCGFDYDLNREVFFRSDSQSLSASRTPTGTAPTLAQAIHASTNAPINYFDEPAKGPAGRRYWDGAIGGYNNPVMAGVIEAIANAQRYDTELHSISALSIGTGNVVLPLAQHTPGEDSDLMAKATSPALLTDVKKLASSILDDPPDAATFHAHVTLGAACRVRANNCRSTSASSASIR